LGRIQKVQCSQVGNLFGKPVDLTGKDPQVQTDQLLAHGLPGHGLNLFGAMEQLMMWDYETLRSVSLAWVPGSGVQNQSPGWRIREDGLWEIQKEDERWSAA
jgi:hypothetical protein